MNDKIVNFKCTDCDVKIRANKILTYTCPNCGGVLVPEDDKYINRLDNDIKGVDEKEIKRILSDEGKIKKLLKKEPLKKIAEVITVFINILKDREVGFMPKAIAAAALAYLINPIDIISDLIPVIGYLDDAAVLMIGFSYIMKFGDAALQKYKKTVRYKCQLSPLIYSVTYNSSNLIYNYEEESKRRIWTISPGEVKKYGLKLINDGLIRVPEVYTRHPYLNKTIVPVNEFDAILSNDMMLEQTNFSKMLGAKSIKINIRDYEEKNKKISNNLDIKNKTVGADTKFDSNNIIVTDSNYYYEFGTFEDINFDYIKDFVWCFTNFNNLYNGLISARIYNEIKLNVTKVGFESNNLMNYKMRAEVEKKNIFDLNIKFSKIVKRDIELVIEFYDLPESIKQKKDEIYTKLNSLMETRKKEIVSL
ncbi:MAG: DUF1232 domain-containing protein [Sedimentibacter sp.]